MNFTDQDIAIILNDPFITKGEGQPSFNEKIENIDKKTASEEQIKFVCNSQLNTSQLLLALHSMNVSDTIDKVNKYVIEPKYQSNNIGKEIAQKGKEVAHQIEKTGKGFQIE
jgi:hypothetical protein